MENKNLKEEVICKLKNTEIEVGSGKINIFERFPDFMPFIGDEYYSNSSKSKKMLFIWESYYDTKNRLKKYDEDTKGWYENEEQELIDEYFCKMFKKDKEKTNYNNHWNFASKMHKNGIDRKSPTFRNVEKVLDEFLKDKNSFKYCAGYNYYLRPATNSSSIKSDPLDEEVAAKALKAIIEKINPNKVVFFSKKASESFKKAIDYFKLDKEGFENIEFETFVHPACAWWNREYKKPKETKKDKKCGRERFRKFIIEDVYKDKIIEK